jgi:hypothetical protein
MDWTPNGLELSGPAKTSSHFRAELAGSAPASGYAHTRSAGVTENRGFFEGFAGLARMHLLSFNPRDGGVAFGVLSWDRKLLGPPATRPTNCQISPCG